MIQSDGVELHVWWIVRVGRTEGYLFGIIIFHNRWVSCLLKYTIMDDVNEDFNGFTEGHLESLTQTVYCVKLFLYYEKGLAFEIK